MLHDKCKEELCLFSFVCVCVCVEIKGSKKREKRTVKKRPTRCKNEDSMRTVSR